MPYKDPDKRREAARLSMRRKRAADKLAKLQGKVKPLAVSVKRTRTITRSDSLSDEDVEGLDLKALTLGKLAIEKALAGIQSVEPETLDPIDVKRLGEFGVGLVMAARDSIEGRAVTEEQSLDFSEAVMSGPDALAHVHALLRLCAAEDLHRLPEAR